MSVSFSDASDFTSKGLYRRARRSSPAAFQGLCPPGWPENHPKQARNRRTAGLQFEPCIARPRLLGFLARFFRRVRPDPHQKQIPRCARDDTLEASVIPSEAQRSEESAVAALRRAALHVTCRLIFSISRRKGIHRTPPCAWPKSPLEWVPQVVPHHPPDLVTNLRAVGPVGPPALKQGRSPVIL